MPGLEEKFLLYYVVTESHPAARVPNRLGKDIRVVGDRERVSLVATDNKARFFVATSPTSERLEEVKHRNLQVLKNGTSHPSF